MLPIINPKSSDNVSPQNQLSTLWTQVANLRDNIEEEFGEINDNKLRELDRRLNKISESKINVVTSISKNTDGSLTVKGCVISAPTDGDWEVTI